MPDPASHRLVPVIARAITDLDRIADLLVAINDARGMPDLISALVLESLTRVESTQLSLTFEAIDNR